MKAITAFVALVAVVIFAGTTYDLYQKMEKLKYGVAYQISELEKKVDGYAYLLFKLEKKVEAPTNECAGVAARVAEKGVEIVCSKLTTDLEYDFCAMRLREAATDIAGVPSEEDRPSRYTRSELLFTPKANN